MSLKELNVGIAELKTSNDSEVLVCPALGSCVAIVVYDPNKKIGALAHIMLPDSKEIKKGNKSAKFADTAIRDMIKKLSSKGVNKADLVAKIIGGAHMFKTKNSFVDDIGLRNVTAAKSILNYEDIPIISEDTGGNYGRTVKFYTRNGRVEIKSIKGKREI